MICLPVACDGLPLVSLWHPAAECNLLYSADICLPVASDLSPFGTQPQNVICYTQLRFVSLLHAAGFNLSPFGTQPQNAICYTQLRFVSLLHVTGGWDYIILKGLTPPRPSGSAGPFLQRRVSSASRILVQRFSQPSCLAFAQRNKFSGSAGRCTPAADQTPENHGHVVLAFFFAWRFLGQLFRQRSMLAIVGADRVASGANFRSGGLVTTGMAAALQLQRTVEYQEKTLPSLIRLGSISLDTQLCSVAVELPPCP